VHCRPGPLPGGYRGRIEGIGIEIGCGRKSRRAAYIAHRAGNRSAPLLQRKGCVGDRSRVHRLAEGGGEFAVDRTPVTLSAGMVAMTVVWWRLLTHSS